MSQSLLITMFAEKLVPDQDPKQGINSDSVSIHADFFIAHLFKGHEHTASQTCSDRFSRYQE